MKSLVGRSVCVEHKRNLTQAKESVSEMFFINFCWCLIFLDTVIAVSQHAVSDSAVKLRFLFVLLLSLVPAADLQHEWFPLDPGNTQWIKLRQRAVFHRTTSCRGVDLPLASHRWAQSAAPIPAPPLWMLFTASGREAAGHPVMLMLREEPETSLMCQGTARWTEGFLQSKGNKVVSVHFVLVYNTLSVCVCVPGAGRQRVKRTSGGVVLNNLSTFCRTEWQLITSYTGLV